MLDDLDRQILAMERRRYRYDGVKATAVRDELGLSMTAYTQRLLTLVDRPEALVEDPVTVWRLRRLRDERRARAGRR